MPLPQPRLFLSAHCLVFLLVVSAKFGYSLSKFFLPATKLRGGHDVIIGIDPCTELLELLKGDRVNGRIVRSLMNPYPRFGSTPRQQ